MSWSHAKNGSTGSVYKMSNGDLQAQPWTPCLFSHQWLLHWAILPLKTPWRAAFMKWQCVQLPWLGVTRIPKQSHQAPAGGTGVRVSSPTLVAQGSVCVHQGSPQGWESPTTQGSVQGMFFHGTLHPSMKLFLDSRNSPRSSVCYRSPTPEQFSH